MDPSISQPLTINRREPSKSDSLDGSTIRSNVIKTVNFYVKIKNSFNPFLAFKIIIHDVCFLSKKNLTPT
jgi:hypothetical protein